MTSRRRRPARRVAGLVLLLCAAGACSSSPQTAAPTTIRTPPGRPSVAKPCAGVPRGRVTTHRLESAATHRAERYRIYQPPGTTVRDQLRILVLLHGAATDEIQWLDVGITSAADCMAAHGEPNRTVIVLVDGSTVERDHRPGAAGPMEHLVVDEILPAVRRRFPNAAGREGTAIGGISLGGGWALQIAAHHPGLFSAAGGHSPAVWLSPGEVQSLARHNTRVWTDVGSEDSLSPRVHEQATKMADADVAVMSMRWEGEHDRRYWSEHTEDYLRFYAQTW